jgi:hypothetical protein
MLLHSMIFLIYLPHLRKTLHYSGTKPARHDDYTKGICYIGQRQGDENISEHLDSHKQLCATATLLFKLSVHYYQKYFIEHSTEFLFVQ